MKYSHRILSRLDNSLRWTGIPDRVADDLSDHPSVDREHRPLRWSPLLIIAFSCVLLALCLIWSPKMDFISPGAAISIITGLVISVMTGAMLTHVGGPLGKSSSKDDEREATLRKESFLFCFGLLAALNGLGQPILLMVSRWQNWQTTHTMIVVFCVLMLNATLLGTLPTLYASWNLRRLPRE